MNTLDIILLICFVPAIIRGLSKGFLEQAVSLAGVIASVWASFHFSSIVSTWIKPYIEVSDTLISVISFASILVVGLVLTVLIAKALTKVIEMAMLGWL
ncbi:MAG: CvpA family protein, partial [Bacteroidales bacterium]|nr:CvpA family protein [Bacteroidales bacterium]